MSHDQIHNHDLVLRCEVTGNPCGTDTWARGHECPCGYCQLWLHPITGYFADVVTAARREIATWTKRRREGVQLQGMPNAPMQGTHL